MGLTRLTTTSTTYLPRDPCGTPRRNLLPKIQRDDLPCKDAAALVHAAELNLVRGLREEGSSPCFTRYKYMEYIPKNEKLIILCSQ